MARKLGVLAVSARILTAILYTMKNPNGKEKGGKGTLMASIGLKSLEATRKKSLAAKNTWMFPCDKETLCLGWLHSHPAIKT